MRNNKGRALDDYLCSPCATGERQLRHGDAKAGEQSPLYVHWKSMFVRTRGKGDPNTIKYYVEKGIQVCLEWHDYAIFKKWALQNGWKPNEGFVLDRINDRGNYAPDNCQWLTKSEHMSKHRN